MNQADPSESASQPSNATTNDHTNQQNDASQKDSYSAHFTNN